MLLMREHFAVEVGLGNFVVRTRKRCFLVAFAVQLHLIGLPRGTGKNRYRARWAFIQFGNHTLWLRRY